MARGGGRKASSSGGGSSTANTKAKKGTGRGQSGARSSAALRVPFGIVAASTAKPDALTPDDFFEGPPVSSVRSLRPMLLRQVFDATLWLRAFERSGGRFGRRKRTSLDVAKQEVEPVSAADGADDADNEERPASECYDETQCERPVGEAESTLGSVDEEDEEPEAEEGEGEVEEEDDEAAGSGSPSDESDTGEQEEEEPGGRGDTVAFNSAKLKQLRQIVQIGTIDAILRGKYYVGERRADGGELNLREIHVNRKMMHHAAAETKMYPSDYVYNRAPVKGKKTNSRAPSGSTEILVVEGDCVDTAISMKHRRGLNPVVLNMASRSNPCGGYRHGTGAQEENLTRRSNLMQCLEDPYQTIHTRQWSYPLPEFGGVYSPKVTFFRRSEADGYAFMEEPEHISVVSVAAYSNPPVEEIDGELRLSGNTIISNFKKKMRAMFNIALENGHDSIVLSAFGCGVFGNPPKHIAQLFREVLRNDFAGCFEMVAFAIIDGANTFQWFNPEGNVLPFSQVFSCPALTVDEFAKRIALDEETLAQRLRKDRTPSASASASSSTETTQKKQQTSRAEADYDNSDDDGKYDEGRHLRKQRSKQRRTARRESSRASGNNL